MICAYGIKDADDLAVAVGDAAEDSRSGLAHDLVCLRQHTLELGRRFLDATTPLVLHLRQPATKRERGSLRLPHQPCCHAQQPSIRTFDRLLRRLAASPQCLRNLAEPTSDAASMRLRTIALAHQRRLPSRFYTDNINNNN
jgi:hypothetical protein